MLCCSLVGSLFQILRPDPFLDTQNLAEPCRFFAIGSFELPSERGQFLGLNHIWVRGHAPETDLTLYYGTV